MENKKDNTCTVCKDERDKNPADSNAVLATYLDKITGKDPDEFYTETISLSDLRPGDILTFSGKGEKSLITKLILCFTNSWISHGALFYQHTPETVLADAGTSGIHGHLVNEIPDERVAYVSRLTKKSSICDKDSFYDESEMVSVLAAARGYLEQDLSYPYMDLVFLAMILLYKDHSKSGFEQSAIIGLLRILSAELKKLLDEKVRHNYTMVCSSYVYQCYLDASKKNSDFKLQLSRDADLRANRNSNRAINTLLELYAEHAAEYDYKTEIFRQSVNETNSYGTLEDWAKKALESANGDYVKLLKNNELSGAIEDLLRTLMNVLGFAYTSIEDLIENARNMQAMFVTPNDLCFNIEKIQKIGKIHLKRIDDNMPIEQIKDYSK